VAKPAPERQCESLVSVAQAAAWTTSAIAHDHLDFDSLKRDLLADQFRGNGALFRPAA
jgi:hypothetical protein